MRTEKQIKNMRKSWEPENKELADKAKGQSQIDFLLLCLRFYRNPDLQGKPVVFCVKCHRAAIFAGCLLNAFQSVSVIACVLLCCSRKLIWILKKAKFPYSFHIESSVIDFSDT